MHVCQFRDIQREWKATDQSIDLTAYILRWFVAVYSPDLSFKGYRRNDEAYTGRHFIV